MTARLRAKLAAPGFVRNVSVLLGGTVLGQAASLALAPVLTRLYSPAQFADLSVYTAVLAILGVTAALGFDLAIPLAASAIELANLIVVAGLALALTGWVIGLAFWLLPSSALAAIWLAPLDDHRALVPLGVACLGGYYVMVAAASCAGRFADIARTRLTQGVGGPLSQIALGLAGVGTRGLAVGFVIGQSSGTLLLLWRVLLGRAELRSAISWRGVRAAAGRYVRFPLFASWSRVVDMAGSGTVLYLLFSTCYPGATAGYMFLAERLVARPLLMVSSSLLQVFTGEAGRMARDDPAALGRRFGQVVPLQLLVALAWILPLNLAAPWLVPVLFGAAWIAAIPCLQALSLSYVALAVLHPVSTTLQLLDRQGLSAAWQVLRLAALVGAALAAWQAGLSAVGALWVCSAVQAAACAGMLASMALCIRRGAAVLPHPQEEDDPSAAARAFQLERP